MTLMKKFLGAAATLAAGSAAAGMPLGGASAMTESKVTSVLPAVPMVEWLSLIHISEHTRPD